MRNVVLIFALLCLIEILAGCSTYRIMKNCHELNATDEELAGFYACQNQFKFWN